MSVQVQVLRWFGYFKEVVPESPRETYRVRRVALHYYLVDDTMDVEEPKQLNSGIDQVQISMLMRNMCRIHLDMQLTDQSQIRMSMLLYSLC